MKKLKEIWESLPKEVRVGVYVVGSAAGAALLDYLKVVEVDNLIIAGVINIAVVLLQTRIPQIKEKLGK